MKLSVTEIAIWKKRHIPYRMRMLDGFRWWCEVRKSGKDHGDITLTVNGQRIDASVLTNGVAESGLMAFRFLLQFLSLQPRRDDDSPSGYALEVIPEQSRRRDDVWAERIDCESADLADFSLEERRACGYTHKRASQGVGHPTVGPEGADFDWLINGSNAIERVIFERIYLGDTAVCPPWYSVLRNTPIG